MPITPLLKINVDVVMVETSISSLKVAVIGVFTAIPVALLVGFVELTVGGVVSDTDVVVKDISIPYAVPALLCATIR